MEINEMYDGPWPAPGYITVEKVCDNKGVSKNAVTQWLKKPGFLGSFVKDVKGRYHIDPIRFESAWVKVVASRKRNFGDAMERVSKSPNMKDDSSGDDAEREKESNYVRARTGNEVVKLALQKLQLEEKRGILVPKDKVRAENYEFARALRDQLLSIPERISAIIAAETDERKVYLRLNEEIKRALIKTEQLMEEWDGEERDVARTS